MHRPNRQHAQRGSPLPTLPEQLRAWILIQLLTINQNHCIELNIISYIQNRHPPFLSFTIFPASDGSIRFATVSLASNKDDILRPQGCGARPSLDLLLSNQTFTSFFGCGNVPCEFLKVKITIPT